MDKEAMTRGLSMVADAGMLSIREAGYLYDVAARHTAPITWVELGCWCGRSLWAAGCGLPVESTLIGVDPCDGMIPVAEGSDDIQLHGCPDIQYDALQAVLGSLKRHCWLHTELRQMRSTEASGFYALGSIDVLLVDADHRYQAVKDDLEAWLPRMKPHGIVIAHDYTDKYPGVQQAINERFDWAKRTEIMSTRFVEVQL